MAVQWEQIAFADKTASKTTAAWSKSIGSGGDYATWAAMIADMPNLIAHEVTVTIKAGTTLTETCNLKNKHGLTSAAAITIQAEKYFPTSGAIPTADSATATTLRDAALATAALGDDYFNGCWVFIVHGTGTDNGFVPITDYVDATGDVIVASWPGTQPDNTSRYIIVGALINGSGIAKGLDIRSCSTSLAFRGIGITSNSNYGIYTTFCFDVSLFACGVYDVAYSGVYCALSSYFYSRSCGIVKCNTINNSINGGLLHSSVDRAYIKNCGISDNNRRGIYGSQGTFISGTNNFGTGNGSWGTYVIYSAQGYSTGTECSGSSGNHSDPGTAGTANADQASAY